jgi:hypothetical protein
MTILIFVNFWYLVEKCRNEKRKLRKRHRQRIALRDGLKKIFFFSILEHKKICVPKFRIGTFYASKWLTRFHSLLRTPLDLPWYEKKWKKSPLYWFFGRWQDSPNIWNSPLYCCPLYRVKTVVFWKLFRFIIFWTSWQFFGNGDT